MLQKRAGKFVSAVFACYLAVAMQACSSSSTTNDTNVIGVIIPYTGQSSTSAFNLEHAILLGIEQVNSAGGAGKKKLSMLPYDSASNLLIGYQVADALVAANPLVILGPQDVSLISAVVDSAQAAGILTLTASETYDVTSSSLAAADYWFRLNPAVTPIATALAQRAYSDGYRKVAICNINDDYGQSYQRVFGTVFQTLGGVVNAYQFQPGTPLSTQAIQAPLDFSPDAIFLATPPDLGADVTNSLALLASNESYTLNGWYFAPSLQSDLFSTNKIPQVAHKGVGAAPKVNTAAEFSQQFAKRWIGELPTNDAFFYYDAVIYLALAMEVASQQNGGAPPTSETLRAAMLSAAMNSGSQVSDLQTGLDMAQSGQPFVYAGVTGAFQFQNTHERSNIVSAFWNFDASGENIVDAN